MSMPAYSSFEHSKNSRKELRHLGTQRALGHLGTWKALKGHSDTTSTRTLKHLGHSDSWALGHSGT